ncbi:MAG TPA: hypothetical protein VLL97_08200, partial [Acidobacteriota bacterium]|nr:hypothetical protein [Acidobacteriota bacterium]
RDRQPGRQPLKKPDEAFSVRFSSREKTKHGSILSRASHPELYNNVYLFHGACPVIHSRPAGIPA